MVREKIKRDLYREVEMINYLIGIGLSILLSGLIGFERESQDKSAGLRTTMLICLGATLTVIFTLELIKIAKPLGMDFDMIRAIAYYLVAIGFVGSGIIYKSGKKVKGITTSALFLPLSATGFFCGLNNYILAIISAGCIYLILKLKYIKIKIIKK